MMAEITGLGIAFGLAALVSLGFVIGLLVRDKWPNPNIRYRSAEDERPRLAVVETVTERELASRLVGLKGTPGLSAVEALLDAETMELLNGSMEEGLTEATMRTRLGGAAALTEFKALLAERIAEAVRTRDEEQEERDKEMAGKHE